MTSQKGKSRDSWSSRTGVILAVTGSAVGLANFLRFPGQAAQFGGGAFMIAYFLSLLIVALPIAWAEWTMGRYGGQHGFSSCPGILTAVCKNRSAKYLGILGVLVPICIYMFYSYIEAWCLGYAINFLNGLNFSSINDASSFWATFIGANDHGSALGFQIDQVGLYLIVATAINFFLVYRGISKGIEKFTRIAVPSLILIALFILFRVLTLGTPNPDLPHNNISNGLGFMWNPTKTYLETYNPSTNTWIASEEIIGKSHIIEKQELAKSNPQTYRLRKRSMIDQLKRPKLWLTAASQVFFSLSVGLGLIITYASYMKRDDDVVLSSLSAASANEFCEIGIGGMMTLPVAFAFLGAAGVVGQSTFGLGFKSLPMVFSIMPFGSIFGFLFFFLLFLAAVNASISCLQPSIAFLEETLHISRRRAVAYLSPFALAGVSFVMWFSKDALALETLNFWAGTFLVFIIASIQVIAFAWIFGIDKGFDEAHKGAAFKIPAFFKFITKYLCPLFLFTIFITWIATDVFGLGGSPIDPTITALTGTDTSPPSLVAWLCIGIILAIALALIIICAKTSSYKLNNLKKES